MRILLVIIFALFICIDVFAQEKDICFTEGEGLVIIHLTLMKDVRRNNDSIFAFSTSFLLLKNKKYELGNLNSFTANSYILRDFDKYISQNSLGNLYKDAGNSNIYNTTFYTDSSVENKNGDINYGGQIFINDTIGIHEKIYNIFISYSVYGKFLIIEDSFTHYLFLKSMDCYESETTKFPTIIPIKIYSYSKLNKNEMKKLRFKPYNLKWYVFQSCE